MKIGISGSYGGMNFGDDAILEGILGELRASVPAEVTVFSRNSADTLARHRVERAPWDTCDAIRARIQERSRRCARGPGRPKLILESLKRATDRRHPMALETP